MSDERIDATDAQFAQAFEALRLRLRELPFEFEFLNDKFSQAVDRLIETNRTKSESNTGRDLPELEELTRYRTEICEDLRAAMRWALEFDTEMPGCARLANVLEAFGDDGHDYKALVLDAQIELDRVRAMFEREAAKAPEPELDPLFALYNRMKKAAGKKHRQVTDTHVAEAFFASLDKADVSELFSQQESRASLVAQYVTKLRNGRKNHPERLWSPGN